VRDNGGKDIVSLIFVRVATSGFLIVMTVVTINTFGIRELFNTHLKQTPGHFPM
jgi:hypothetical protein